MVIDNLYDTWLEVAAMTGSFDRYMQLFFNCIYLKVERQ